MGNKTELSAADFALYLGCECITPYGFQGTLISVFIRDNTVTLECNETRGGWFIKDVLPILRPLSDITDEEEMEVQNHVDKMGLGYNAVQGAEITRYLLSRHFDLFEWIPAGLAIDKTKL